MPIVYVSGLAPSEKEKKIQIRDELQENIGMQMGVPPQHVTVVCIYDDTIDESEHVMIALVSKQFKSMSKIDIEDVCDLARNTVAPIAQHPYHEAFTLKNRGMFGEHFR